MSQLPSMASLTLIEGPAGSNKSALVRERIEAGESDVVADLTAIWAAVRGMERGANGKYPIRTDSDAAIRTGLAAYIRRTVVRQALRSDLRVIVTSGSRHEAEIYAGIAEELGAAFERVTIDPGENVVRERLSVDGKLPQQCENAIQRWYA